MPGIFGAIHLGVPSPAARAEDLVSAMLGQSRQQSISSTKYWKCPSGAACFASAGVEGLPRGVHVEELGLHGLCYGSAIFPRSAQEDWLGELKGFHCLAVRDDHFGGYCLAADRRGSQPVYYATVAGFLCFAPEVRALLCLPGISREPDYGALGSLVASGHLLEDATLFRAIRRLQGGCCLRVRGESFRRSRYWDFLPGSRAQQRQSGDLVGQLGEIIDRAVEGDLSPDPRGTAIFLSGGCDSRVILGAARRFGGLHTVSWGLDRDAKGTDAEIAQRLAALCGSEHIFLARRIDDFGAMFEEANAITEGQSDAAAFHPQEFRLMRELKQRGFRRVIRGDETFGWKRMNFSRLGAFAHVGLRRFGEVEGLPRLFHPIAARKIIEENACLAEDVLRTTPRGSENQLKDYFYFHQRLQNYLNSCASFKHSLFEHLNPLLADEVLDFLRLVPDEMREDKQLLRALLEKHFPDLHAIGYAASDGLENWSALWRQDTPVRAYLRDQLQDDRSAVWRLYDRVRIREVFESGDERSSCGAGSLLKRSLTRLGRDLAKPFSRRAGSHLQARLALRAPMAPTKTLLRFIVVKNWVDRYEPDLS